MGRGDSWLQCHEGGPGQPCRHEEGKPRLVPVPLKVRQRLLVHWWSYRSMHLSAADSYLDRLVAPFYYISPTVPSPPVSLYGYTGLYGRPGAALYGRCDCGPGGTVSRADVLNLFPVKATRLFWPARSLTPCDYDRWLSLSVRV